MIKSYLQVGWRNLLNNKVYSLINVGGLAMGMTTAMFIGFWIYDELSFNKYHANYSRIAQLWNGHTDPATSQIRGTVGMQYPVAGVLKSNYSQYFKHVVKAYWINDFPITSGEYKFSKVGEFIEPEGLEMLSIKMIKGNYKSLDDAHSIILSESAAAEMFGAEDPMNKSLRISNEIDVQVTGIYEDIPQNSAFGTVEFFAPWSLWALSHPWIKNAETDWDNKQFPAFVEIQPDVSFEQVNVAIKDLYKDHVPADFYATIERSEPFARLVPMSTWHLYSEFENGRPSKGRITFVWLFGIVGIFVLLLACINFVNLSTARSEQRAREVGVRKSIGSSKNQLVVQFLSESFVVVVLSFMLSLLLLMLFQQPFNQLSDKDIHLPFTNLFFWMIAVGFVIITGLAAGMYPAFYLSSFQPVKVLKGRVRTGRLAALPRKVLVVLQFTVSVTLSIGTVVVYDQVQFARNRPVGYNQDGLITVRMNDPSIRKNMNALKTELMNSGAVYAVALSSSPLTGIWNFISGYNWAGKDPNLEGDFATCWVTPEYGRTINWNIVEGRDFSEDITTDTTNVVIVNRAAVKYMGLKDPVGQQLIKLDEFGVFIWSKTIVGVIEDVVMSSPYEPVRPTVYFYRPEMFGHIQIRINPTKSASEALLKIKSVFDKIVPTALFEYSFVDEVYGRKFSQEESVGKLAGVFAVLAIVISCLGLFGLASFVAEQRTKEIGIRKVMGASVATLWRMLSKEFAVLVVISCAAAVPIGYYMMNSWLQKLEYRTEISLWVFLTTCVSAIAITLMTVSYQSIKAA
ncbi:MAG TPA: FtsX-like permease family protein, partial [Chryseolinea sp.]|nr:FtsX-like permease family protein [Chryseolinea sp.]